MAPETRLSRRSFLSLAGAGGLAAPAAVATARAGATPRASALPLALVYLGPACDPGCAFSIGDILASGPSPMRVLYCGPDGDVPITAATLARASLYVQPGGGGDDYDAAWRLVQPKAALLRGWVRSGGRYLGICMGGYMAGHGPGYDLLPGNSWEWTGTPGASVTGLDPAVVTVNWAGEDRQVFYQDGPCFTLRPGRGGRVLATYDDGRPAAVVAPCGKGRVLACGVHPEADPSWYEGLAISPPARGTLDLARAMVTEVRR